MLRIGLVLLGLSACIALLFALLAQIGIAHFGSCGPDSTGLVLIIGFIFSGGIGTLLTLIGLINLAFDRLSQRAHDKIDA
jgi:hypothetical protein